MCRATCPAVCGIAVAGDVASLGEPLQRLPRGVFAALDERGELFRAERVQWTRRERMANAGNEGGAVHGNPVIVNPTITFSVHS